MSNDPMGDRMKKVSESCHSCGSLNAILPISLSRSLKRNDGNYICPSCKHRASAHKKPQCCPAGWDATARERHGQTMRNSKTYQDAIPYRNLSGAANHMFGKKASDNTKKKMSLSRIGKIGENATAWKGGKRSLNCRVKGLLHTRYNWYFRVYQRDGFRCTECGSSKKIDAHHKRPISTMIREFGKSFVGTDDEKLEWLVSLPEIRDPGLLNGQTLCRECHKKAHRRWGSHHANS